MLTFFTQPIQQHIYDREEAHDEWNYTYCTKIQYNSTAKKYNFQQKDVRGNDTGNAVHHIIVNHKYTVMKSKGIQVDVAIGVDLTT